MRWLRHKYTFLLFSITFHCVFFLTILLYFEETPQIVSLGSDQADFINTYISSQPPAPEVVAQTAEKPSLTQQPTPIETKKNTLALFKKTPKRPLEKKSQRSSRANSTSKGQQTEILLTLLHSAIQAQQHYPASARQMAREGRTTLKFMLYPNGTISHLEISHPSGTESLDQAALAAVTHAVPFKQIDKYLLKPQECRVDVVFALT